MKPVFFDNGGNPMTFDGRQDKSIGQSYYYFYKRPINHCAAL